MASKWNGLVEKTEDGKALPSAQQSWTATVLELPSVHAIADTQQDAIDRAQRVLSERLAQAKIVSIQLESSENKPKNPVLESLGFQG